MFLSGQAHCDGKLEMDICYSVRAHSDAYGRYQE
jgi:hypothetical protein